MSNEPPALAHVGGYRIDLLLQGFPGKATHHGGLGWSTVALLRGHGRVILLDTGGPGQRAVLRQRLEARGLTPADVTDLLLTHPHWDHIANVPMFPAATLHAGEADLLWANSGASDVYAVSEPQVRDLLRDPRLNFVTPGTEVFPGLVADIGPGHTPAHLTFLLSGDAGDVIFAQDAAKSMAEVLSGDTDLTLDPAASRTTIARLRAQWQRREGNILIPGHDLPLLHRAEGCQRLGLRAAGISANFGEDLADRTHFPLTERQS